MEEVEKEEVEKEEVEKEEVEKEEVEKEEVEKEKEEVEEVEKEGSGRYTRKRSCCMQEHIVASKHLLLILRLMRRR